ASRFATNSALKKLTPVALPSGRARLATRPNLTASPPTLNTIGITVFAALTARNGSRRTAGHDDNRDPTANEFGRQLRHTIILALGPAILDRDVLPFDKADFAETSAECRKIQRERIERAKSKKSDHRHRRLLRVPRERPSRCRAAEQRDK